MSIVKSFSVGDGDMFYIEHGSDNFTVIDCCYSDEENRKAIFNEIREKGAKKGINRFISTHPDEDHITGLKEFKNQIGIHNFYCVQNEASKKDPSENFEEYCKLRDGDKHYYLHKGCSRKWMNESDEERGSSGLTCLWPILSNDDYKEALEKAKDGDSPNNISPIIKYSIENGGEFMWMGDLEADFMDKMKDKIAWPKIDILFAPHHGRSSGKVHNSILNLLKPSIIVVGEAPSKDLEYYSGYNTITQNSAGDIVFDCDGEEVNIYVSNPNYSVDFLENKRRGNLHGYYIGTLTV